MNSHDDDREDWLDTALRTAGRDHRADYIADDGFSARVLSALPPAYPALPAWRRPAIALLWLVATGAAIVAVPGIFDDVFRGAVGLLVSRPLGLRELAGMLALCAAFVWGATLYAARTR
ncbi:MAG TPA: hypothetical protein VJQ49_09485 [Casimicrobiaceae bacterium]|nr:hypothetical protein [Casimicrobiaceae bacterium]